MGTSAIIALYNEGKYDYIYCKYDGYLSKVGFYLLEYYKDIDKIKSMISLGDLVGIGKEIGSKHNISFMERFKNFAEGKPDPEDWCFFILRDKMENVVYYEHAEHKTKSVSTKEELISNCSSSFLYLYENNCWHIMKTHHKNPRFRKLTHKMCVRNEPWY